MPLEILSVRQTIAEGVINKFADNDNADEVNFVISLCVETSERFLSVDGGGKIVVRLAFDENIKKRNLLVLFKFSPR